MLNSTDFIKLREKDWQRLQTLLDTHQGRKAMTANEVRELGNLYRAVTSDLALARRDYPGQRITIFLNQLLTRAHSFIYQEDVTDFRPFVRYFTRTLPQTFRQTWLFTLIAFLMFLIPAIVGYRLTSVNPDIADPLGLANERQTLAEHDVWTNIPVNERPYMSGFIMTNNIKVTLLAFGGGMSLGLFTIYVLAMNGLSVGGVLGLAAHYGMAQSLLQFMFGHGVIELSVIFMVSGAGLQLGWAVLHPGRYTRRDSLNLASRRAVTLALSGIPLLIIAGTIEGFLSPSDLPFGVHVAVGVVSGILLYGYFILAGRGKSIDEAPRQARKSPAGIM